MRIEPSDTFIRGGYRYTVTKAAKWREEDHPRDRLGRFIETGAEVRVWGGALARVVRNVGGGRIEVERLDDKRHVIVHRNYLTVTARPDGTAPTSDRNANVGTIDQGDASPDAVDEPEPTTAPDVDAASDAAGLDGVLAQRDPDLAERVRTSAAAYQAALGNGVPDDEADERAALVSALDEVDANHSGDADVRRQSQLLRQAATAEPDPDAPAAPASRRAAPERPAATRPEGTTPAPDATPDGALSRFTGDDGSEAWLSVEDGQPVGYLREQGGTPVRYDDSEAWAAEVDGRGMTEGEPEDAPVGAATATDADSARAQVAALGPGERTEIDGVEVSRSRDDVRRGGQRMPQFLIGGFDADAVSVIGERSAVSEAQRLARRRRERDGDQPEGDAAGGERINDDLTVSPGDYVTDEDGDTYTVGQIGGDQVRFLDPNGRPALILPRGGSNRAARTMRAATDTERAAYDAEASRRGQGDQPEDANAAQPEDGQPSLRPTGQPERRATLDDARNRLSAYAEGVEEQGYRASYASRTNARTARAIVAQDDSYLRLSPDGGVIARRYGRDGRWKPYAVANAVELLPSSHNGFDEDKIDEVLTRFDALGIPFGDTDALRARWTDSERKRADMEAMRGLVNDPDLLPTPTDDEVGMAFRLAVAEYTPRRRNARVPPEFGVLMRARDAFYRGRRGDGGENWQDEVGRILRDENIGDARTSQNLLDMWRRYTGDTSEPESREQRAERIARESRERAGLDDRFTVTGSGLYASTLSNMRPGDVIYTHGAGTEASPVELPRRPRGGVLPRTDRIPRTIDRVEGRGNNRTVHFTDGTSTGAEGGDRTGATYSGRAAVFGVPADQRPAPGEPTPIPTPVLLPETPADHDEARRNALAMFNFTAPNGWKTRLRVQRVSSTQTTVRGEILNEQGIAVGTVQRSILRRGDEIEVHHDLLTISPRYQGGGFADAYYKHLYEQYEANGVDLVTINANIDVGGYAWAQRGFDWNNGRSDDWQRSRMAGNIDNVLAGLNNRGASISGLSLTDEQRQRVEAFRQELRTNPDLTPRQIANSLSDIRWTETTVDGKEIPMWPGKRALLGTSWHGTYRVGTQQGPRVDPFARGDQPEQPAGDVITPADWMNARAGRGRDVQRADWYTIAYDDPEGRYTPRLPDEPFEVRNVQEWPGGDGYSVMIRLRDGSTRELEVPGDARLTPAAQPTGDATPDDQGWTRVLPDARPFARLRAVETQRARVTMHDGTVHEGIMRTVRGSEFTMTNDAGETISGEIDDVADVHRAPEPETPDQPAGAWERVLPGEAPAPRVRAVAGQYARITTNNGAVFEGTVVGTSGGITEIERPGGGIDRIATANIIGVERRTGGGQPETPESLVPDNLADLDDQALQNELDALYYRRGEVPGDSPEAPRVQEAIDAIEAEQQRRQQPDVPATVPGRFGTDMAAVRRHIDSIDRDSGREARARIAADPMAVLSDDGRWIIHRNPDATPDTLGWRITAVGNGVHLPGEVGTREEGLAIANRLQAARDIDGNPFPADSDDVQGQVRRWADSEGNRLPDLFRQARVNVDETQPRDEDWQDSWAQDVLAPPESGDGSVDLPDDLTELSDDELDELENRAADLDDTWALGQINEERDRREIAREDDEGGGGSREQPDNPAHRILPGDDSDDVVEENVRQMFSYTHPETGWSTSFGVDIERASRWGGRDVSTVQGYIVDRDGRGVGEVTRTVYMNTDGEVEVHHDYLVIYSQHQGQGFADAYYKHLYEQYEQRGVDVVSIQANIDVGGYAWAQRGFDWAPGEPSYARTVMMDRLDDLARGLVDGARLDAEQRRRVQELRRAIQTGDMTPKQIANSLSDIRWTKTTRGGKQISMWPGKYAMLGTNWNGVYRVGATSEPDQPERPAITVDDKPVSTLSDKDLADESDRNADLIGRLTNVEGRGDDHPDVVALRERQGAIVTERQRRIAEASVRLIPDGEDVAYTELRQGDTVVIPFITEDGPQLAEVFAVVPGPMDTVVLRLDDGTRRTYTLIPGTSMMDARWRRGRVATPQPVRAADLNAGDRVVLDDGNVATIDDVGDYGGDSVSLTIDDGSPGGFIMAVDRDAVYHRLPAAEADQPQPDVVPDIDPAEMSDDEMRVEVMQHLALMAEYQSAGQTAPTAVVNRVLQLNAERRARDQAAADAVPVDVEDVDTPTARPRLYTYQRRNLVALGLDTRGSSAPDEVKQAAARVRNRMPLTAEQSDALANHLHALAEDDSLGVRKQRSIQRLALSFDASAAVARGRAEGANQPVVEGVSRVRPTGLTAGDTIVIRGRDGSLRQVKVLDAKPMMRGTLARLTLEHPEGWVETRIVDRDVDTWLVPDLPDPKPVAPEPRQVREMVFASDIRPGDRIIYDTLGPDGIVEAVVDAVDERHGDRYITVNGQQLEASPTELRTRLARGDASADQPYWLTTTATDPETITGADVRVGDLIEDVGLTNMRGTVVDVTEVEGEGGVRGWQFQVVDSDRGYINSFSMYGPQTVTRQASAGDNGAASVQAMAEERDIRQRLGGALGGLEAVQEKAQRAASAGLVNIGMTHENSPQFIAADADRRETVLTAMSNNLRNSRRMLEAGGGDDPAYPISLALSGSYRTHPQYTEHARRVALAAFDDTAERLTNSIRNAEPLPGESDVDMLRRVLTQWRDNPPTRHNEAVARSLIRGAGRLGETTADVQDKTPALPEGDLSSRMDTYRQMLGGRFGYRRSRVATYGDLDFDALERGEVPEVTYTDTFERDTAEDGGPGAHTMRQLDTVRAAGADLDANIRETERRLFAARLRSASTEFDPIGDNETVAQYRERMQQRETELSEARTRAHEAITQFDDNIAADQGFASIAQMNNRRTELRVKARRDGLTDEERAEQARLDAAWARIGNSDESPNRAAAVEAFRVAREAHLDYSIALRGLGRMEADARRRAAIEVLSQVRQIGGVRLDYQAADPTRRTRGSASRPGSGRNLGERDQNVRNMRTAEDALPADWLNAIREHVRTEYGRERIGIGSLRRGHADYRGNIRLSPDHSSDGFEGNPGAGGTAVHELGHFAQRSVPGILAAENAFLWSRTSRGEVGSRERDRPVNMGGRGGDRSQYGYTDEFATAYTGVDYGMSRGRSREAYEVITTGLESLMAGSRYLDDDFRRWLLGTMALL